MSERAFLDTNVLVYAVGDEEPKRSQAEALVRALAEGVISSQVIAEFVNVCLRRSLMTPPALRQAVRLLVATLETYPVEGTTAELALRLHERYGFSWWDSLILASALESGCEVVYTEDLHNGQVIGSSGLRTRLRRGERLSTWRPQRPAPWRDVLHHAPHLPKADKQAESGARRQPGSPACAAGRARITRG
ncbi:MAG: PIN domain-containing protein [Rhodothermales bacterium]